MAAETELVTPTVAGSVSAAPVSRVAFWAGWVLSVLPCLMLFMSAAMKLAQPDVVMEGFEKMGYPRSLALKLGIVEVVCTVLYLFPRTAVLGAVLLTGYLGGAVATHVRVEELSFVTPVLLGVVIWLGLYLRDRRVRDLLPLRR